MNVINRAFDFGDAPAKLQPNKYNDTQAEVVFQGRMNVLTKSVSSYPSLVIPGGRFATDKIEIVSLMDIN